MLSAECGKTMEQIPGVHFLQPWKGLINVLTLVKKNSILGYNLIRSLHCANLHHLSTIRIAETQNKDTARHPLTTFIVWLVCLIRHQNCRCSKENWHGLGTKQVFKWSDIAMLILNIKPFVNH